MKGVICLTNAVCFSRCVPISLLLSGLYCQYQAFVYLLPLLLQLLQIGSYPPCSCLYRGFYSLLLKLPKQKIKTVSFFACVQGKA